MNLTPPTDDELAAMIREETWFIAVTQDRIADQLQQLAKAMDEFDVRRCALAARAARLLGEQLHALGLPKGAKRRQTMEVISEQAEALRGQLHEALEKFTRRTYHALLPDDVDLQVCDDRTRAMSASRVDRFEEMCTDAGKCIAITDSMIERCNTKHEPTESKKEQQKQ